MPGTEHNLDESLRAQFCFLIVKTNLHKEAVNGEQTTFY